MTKRPFWMAAGAAVFSAVAGIAMIGAASAPSEPGKISGTAKTVSAEARKAPAGAKTAVPAKTVHGDYVSSKPSMEVAVGDLIQGDAVSLGGNLHVRGEVTGEAVAVGGNVYFYKGAKVGHQMVAVGGKVIIEDGADPNCDTQSVNVPFVRPLMRGLASSGLMDVETKGSGHHGGVNIKVGNGKHGEESYESEEEGDEGGDWEFTGRDVPVTKDTVVNGDVKLVKGNLSVDGRVRGDVKVVKGNAEINGKVGGSVKTVRGNVTVSELGLVDGDVKSVGGKVTINGHVGGTIKSVGGDVLLGPHSHVVGSVRLVGGHFTRADGAVVDGSIKEGRMNPFGYLFDGMELGEGGGAAISALGYVGRMFVWLALALLAGLVLAKPLKGAARFVSRRPVASAATGFASWFAAVLACVALILTCIGILLSPVPLVAFVALLVAGILACGYCRPCAPVRTKAVYTRRCSSALFC